MFPTVFIGSFVSPQHNHLEIFNDHVLEIDERGFISAFFPCSSREGERILNLTPKEKCRMLPRFSFMLPTFCDLHLHAPQMLYLGTGLHLPLLEWLGKYAYNAEERIDGDIELASKVYTRLARRLIENGTGAALLFGTIKTETNLLLAKIFQQAGVRAFVGKLLMDISSRPSYKEESSSAAVESARTFIQRCRELVSDLPVHERLIHPVITPRFIPTCSSELLSRLGELAAETSTMVQSHMAESKDEVEWVKEDRNAEDIDIFAKSGLLTSCTIQAHCTFLPPSTMPRLNSTGTAIAHCPLSNTYFSSRPFPLREALHNNVKVGLGTDIAGGYQIDIMSSMRMTVIVSKMRENERMEQGSPDSSSSSSSSSLEVTWKEALYMGTIGGAKALGLQTGEHPFEVGLPFDAQQINLYNENSEQGIGNIDFFDSPTGNVTEELVEKWWCLGDAQNRSAVYIQGKSRM